MSVGEARRISVTCNILRETGERECRWSHNHLSNMYNIARDAREGVSVKQE